MLLALAGIFAVWYWSRDQEKAVPAPPPRTIKPGPTVARRLPAQSLSGGYASADACRECHTSEHASWHRSYHRTMTQAVSAETIAAPLESVRLESRNRVYDFEWDGERLLVDLVDPEWDALQRAAGIRNPAGDGPRVRRQIVMSTGSHHYQTFWINGTRGNQLWQVPWVYHLAERRWIPAEDAFVSPPGDHRRLTDWNDNCIQCHAVAGNPRLDSLQQLYRTTVVDLGIACEACHGPGQAHIDFQRQLVESDDRPSSPDDTIVNPARLPHDRSAQVCGQCHSSSVYEAEEFLQAGFDYRPGDDLTVSRLIHSFDDEQVQSRPQLRDAYWPDGTMRLAGREYSAMDDSACYLKGQISCVTCHSMHDFESPDDQLRATMRTDQACLQCHESYADDISDHTHHAPESSGSRCANCHMPHTSFGLLKAIRSHRIDSPTAAMTRQHGRPNACNLCHADQPITWTARHLTDWFGHEPIDASDLASELSSSVLFLVSGDAVQRAVTAWNLGREETRAASGTSWQAPLLAQLLEDPYAAVRYSAYKAIITYPGLESFEYDFLAPEPDRADAHQEALQLWQQSRTGDVVENPQRLLMSPTGEFDSERLQTLLKFRDDRPVTLPE